MLVVVTGITLFLLQASRASEKPVKMEDLPSAVQKTVREQSKGATIRGLTREVERGKTSYEVELTVNGRSKDIEMDSTGAILEVEEEVALDALSPAVKAGLEKQAAPGKILKVESVSRRGKIVSYEARVERAGKKSEIAVKPDGTPVKPD